MTKKKRIECLAKLHKAFGDVFIETDVSVSDSMELLNDYYACMVRQYEEQFVPAYHSEQYRLDVAVKLMVDIGCAIYVDASGLANFDEDDTVH